MSIDSENEGISRRSFLIKGGILAAAASGLISCRQASSGRKTSYTGGIIGQNRKAGHMLIEGRLPAPTETNKTGIVIVGGGIAGLSAAWEIEKRRVRDYILLELEDRIGGNSISGENPVSKYPWAAHYVPIPGEGAVFVRELFEELGIIEGYDAKGLPVYNEYYLCADPQERLFIHGQWQEGLVPQLGADEKDRRQYDEFFGMMDRFKKALGSDGRPAFSIPIEDSSTDSRFRRLDEMSMSKFLSENGWDSEYLRWYVDYCCRDDYGCTMDNVSAWAGIHYFASRTGAASNADPHAVVTWPEGNCWIADKMTEKVRKNVRTNACVINIERTGDGLAVDYYDVGRGTVVRIGAKAVVYCAPRFTSFRTIRDFRERRPDYATHFGYAPWMIANVTVRGIPSGKGAPISWDNVCFKAESLGYVFANHQDITTHRDKTVLTCYFPLTAGDPVSERTGAARRSYEEWAGMVAKELSKVHPDIEKDIEDINVWIWGHAMIRPVPGFIWGEARRKALKPHGRIFFAHSDMSGISIFEEAQYRGIMAARAALKEIKL